MPAQVAVILFLVPVLAVLLLSARRMLASQGKSPGIALTLLTAMFVSQNAGAARIRADLLSEGHRLAEAWCQSCHAIEPHMAGLYDGAPSFFAIANRRGTTALSLKVFLKTSHQNMPNLVTAPEQADALVSYILSLKTK